MTGQPRTQVEASPPFALRASQARDFENELPLMARSHCAGALYIRWDPLILNIGAPPLGIPPSRQRCEV